MEPFAYLKKMQFINGTFCLSKKNTVRKWNHVKKNVVRKWNHVKKMSLVNGTSRLS